MLLLELHVKGMIDQQWSDWFGGLEITSLGYDETVLTGTIPDQAALYGIISRLRDMGLQLTLLRSEEVEADHH